MIRPPDLLTSIVWRDADLSRAARVDRLRAERADDGDAERVEERSELIAARTLRMNRARQAEITQEILEVVAGANALTA
jgi:hypothetical protein